MAPLLTHTSLLAALALGIRGVGVALRREDAAWLRIPGWLVCAIATWAAAGVAGAFSPIWPVVGLGVLAGAVAGRWASSWLVAAADIAVLGMVLATSVPALPWGTAGAFLAVLAVAWGALEMAAGVAPRSLRIAGGLAAAAVTALLLLTLRFMGAGKPLLPLPGVLPHLAVSSECEAAGVDLPGGGAAWLVEPSRPTGRAALFLHGADPLGSRQPSACVFRRALAHAGFLTLAVDHPGYGRSPAPARDAALEQWDPLRVHGEAYDWLVARPDVRQVVVVGHSMGGTDALRLAGARPDIPLLFLFAASLPDPPGDYHYMRFHRDRGITDSLPRDRWREIREAHYDPMPILERLSASDARVVFVFAGREWDNVRATRDSLYRLLPGPKESWHLEGASHYLNAFTLSGVLVGDARVARRVARGVRERTAERLGSPEAIPAPESRRADGE